MSKSVHQIEIREDVWKRVEALAQRRGVSTDEIVQAALVQLFSRKRPTAPPSAQPTVPVSTMPEGVPPKPAPAPASAPAPAPPSRRPPPPTGSGALGLPPPGSGARPMPRPASRPPSRPPAGAPALYLWCEGAWYKVDQDEFVIGRGQKYSDLPIRDGNISRRHASIVRRNGAYYMTDLGSTNGVEFDGQRVDNHLIREGSVYYLCDHELRFTFNAPA